MTFVEAERNGVNGVTGLNGARWVAPSPDGKHVYVAAFYSDAVAVFATHPDTGGVDFVEAVADSTDPDLGLDGATGVVVSSDGRHVYVSGRFDHALTAFHRDSGTGKLSLLGTWTDGAGGVDGIAGAYSVSISRDGRFLYVPGWIDNAVTVFARDKANGSVQPVQTVWDGCEGVDGLDGATTISWSPNGHNAYVTAIDDASVAVFHRKPADGRLSFLEVHRNQEGGADCLTHARSSWVSNDGGTVVVSGRDDSALCVFERSRNDGRLSFLRSYHDGLAGIDGIDGTTSVTMSRNGKYVLATGRWDDAVAIFSRDPGAGTLGLLEVHRDGVDGVTGLGEALHVAADRSGKAVYVAGFASDALVVFRKALFGDGFETSNAVLWNEDAWQYNGVEDPCSLCSSTSSFEGSP